MTLPLAVSDHTYWWIALVIGLAAALIVAALLIALVRAVRSIESVDHVRFTFRAALRCLAERQVGSLLLEGGAAVHAAAWDEGLVDYVRLYITPHVLGDDGVPLLPHRSFSSADLHERRVAPLGPDVLIEGYVHGAR